MSDRKPVGRLADVSGKNVDIQPEAHYDGWASSYDTDLLDGYGYCAHKLAARALAGLLNDTNASIMDVGCGTGLVGAELNALGFSCIDGLDISANMLAEANRLGIYRNLVKLDAESANTAAGLARYTAAISVGTFGLGHMGPEGLARVSGFAKPGCPTVIFMNAEPFVDMQFQNEIERLDQAGIWQLESIEDHNYMDALERPGKLIIARSGQHR